MCLTAQRGNDILESCESIMIYSSQSFVCLSAALASRGLRYIEPVLNWAIAVIPSHVNGNERATMSRLSKPPGMECGRLDGIPHIEACLDRGDISAEPMKMVAHCPTFEAADDPCIRFEAM